MEKKHIILISVVTAILTLGMIIFAVTTNNSSTTKTVSTEALSEDTFEVTLGKDDTGILAAIAVASEGKTDMLDVIYPLIPVGDGTNDDGLPVYIFENNETSKFYVTSYLDVHEVSNTDDGTVTTTREIAVMGPVDANPNGTKIDISTENTKNSAHIIVEITMKGETIENISFDLEDYTGDIEILKEIAPAILY
jgi:hypothetical protein